MTAGVPTTASSTATVPEAASAASQAANASRFSAGSVIRVTGTPHSFAPACARYATGCTVGKTTRNAG
jgi:hypothetical protein